MALIKTVSPEKAEGKIGEVYRVLQEKIGLVPKPFEMMSASPALMLIRGQMIDYFMNHPTLGPRLLTMIRLLSAEECAYDFCVGFNTEILKHLGVDETQTEAFKADLNKVPLDEKNKAMLLFVAKAIRSPETVKQEDVDALRDLGWTDSDIFDATFHGAAMAGPSILFKAFQMGQE